jgi:Coenzyme PQQ synthesis protein D (PqqD)
MKLRRKHEWISSEVGKDMILMSITNGHIMGLNQTGVRIWEMLEQQTDYDRLIAQLTADFDVPAEACRVDVDRFIAELQKHDAIVIE